MRPISSHSSAVCLRAARATRHMGQSGAVNRTLPRPFPVNDAGYLADLKVDIRRIGPLAPNRFPW